VSRRRRVSALSAHDRMRALIGLSPSAYIRLGMAEDSWRRWDRVHGAAYRLQHGIGTSADRELLERMPALLSGAAPDPPGFGLAS